MEKVGPLAGMRGDITAATDQGNVLSFELTLPGLNTYARQNRDILSVLIIAMPYPILLPPWVPNGPLGRGFLRPVWDRGGCEGVVPVICYWIGRRILVQIYDLTVDGGLC